VRLLSAVLWLASLLAVSGLALMFLYFPEYTKPVSGYTAPPGITVGSIFRGAHFWLAQLIVLAALAHGVRVVFVKTNRPRLGWALAVTTVTGLLWFTGMLLPWDRLANWLPVWAGGLLGVYWTHTLALSLLLLLLMIAYFGRLRRDRARN